MRTRILFAMLAALLVTVALAGIVVATQAAGVSSTPIATGNLDADIT